MADGPRRILVVDDDPLVRKCIAAVLESWGYRAITAAHGSEALDVLSDQKVDGIVLDVHMPVMDGPTMLDELRWRRSRVPVVVMSGEADHRFLRSLLQEGAQGFVIKPVALDDLRSICRQIFGEPAPCRVVPSQVA